MNRSILGKMLIMHFLFSAAIIGETWIRINQLGYLENSIKVAVLISQEDVSVQSFQICDTDNKVVWESASVKEYGEIWGFKNSFRLDFSNFQTRGEYYIKTGEAKSPVFIINNNVYDGTADFVLQYMRQQRCGYNPFLKDSCHTKDGFIVDHLTRENEYIDVTGGWHDATDYLQYLTTSANATYQLMFAYTQNPDSFKDNYDKDGMPGSNGIPDIIDEAKWGIDWLLKMNPEYGIMFNQIADDRDHAGFRLPNKDSVNYGQPFGRPVYFVTGKSQGLSKHKNRTEGVSSTAGKYASAFALGSKVLKEFYPELIDLLKKKAKEAYNYAKTDLGTTQTACYKSPYFYEEDNYVDDLELAAAQLYEITNDEQYLKEAAYWGDVEPVTPWMGADTARHYQWYPFVNLGHYLTAFHSEGYVSRKFKDYMRRGLNNVYEKGKNNPFLFGVPFIWCSNNLVAAMITQAHLYYKLSGDDTYAEMEAALRDWLFGCNPWGTSMIVELPKHGDYPEHPHSSLLVVEGYQTTGGLVDGPVYKTIFNRLAWLRLIEEDEYAQFQNGIAVYHDDYGDYSTNEPTMDGTASLTYYLSLMQKLGQKSRK